MKKILLLSITSLALLMADFTLTGKQLTPVNEPAVEPTPPVVESTPPPTPTGPVNTSGIIPNSVDLIWEDMHDKPTGYPVITHGGYPQFQRGQSSYREGAYMPRFNAWCEIEEEGDLAKFMPNSGGGCLKGSNQATNTRVLASIYRGWWLDYNGKWHSMTGNSSTMTGKISPQSGNLMGGGRRDCWQDYFTDILEANQDRVWTEGVMRREESNSQTSFKPQNYFRWHGFGLNFTPPADKNVVKAVYIQQWFKLIIEDPTKPDDRHLARFVAHVASDFKDENGLTMSRGDLGISRFKRITKDWQCFNMITSGTISKEELIANPPPFSEKP